MLALLIGCGLRRAELVGLGTKDFQVREDPVVTENSVRSENTGVPIIREIMVATTMSSLFDKSVGWKSGLWMFLRWPTSSDYPLVSAFKSPTSRPNAV
jgi:integrase